MSVGSLAATSWASRSGGAGSEESGIKPLQVADEWNAFAFGMVDLLRYASAGNEEYLIGDWTVENGELCCWRRLNRAELRAAGALRRKTGLENIFLTEHKLGE